MTPQEPTSEQCSARATWLDGERRCMACWYPQMGGYVGKAVVVTSGVGKDESTCFEAYVWHDGEFPFDGRPPVELHHCEPGQFIDFGEAVLALQQRETV